MSRLKNRRELWAIATATVEAGSVEEQFLAWHEAPRASLEYVREIHAEACDRHYPCPTCFPGLVLALEGSLNE